MSIYLIHAYEDLYDGDNGMEDWDIIEGTPEEVVAHATEMSYDIIESYSCITKILKEQAGEYISYDEEDEELSEEEYDRRFENYYSECIMDDIAYTIYALNNSNSLEQYLNYISSGAYSYEELANEFSEEEFI